MPVSLACAARLSFLVLPVLVPLLSRGPASPRSRRPLGGAGRRGAPHAGLPCSNARNESLTVSRLLESQKEELRSLRFFVWFGSVPYVQRRQPGSLWSLLPDWTVQPAGLPHGFIQFDCGYPVVASSGISSSGSSPLRLSPCHTEVFNYKPVPSAPCGICSPAAAEGQGDINPDLQPSAELATGHCTRLRGPPYLLSSRRRQQNMGEAAASLTVRRIDG